ncbi:MAG: hypothetical protein NTY81_03410 [Candidatus Staskawiczbacteria bacterium]|nr:hypothetical protein [Candidatus Staskawiczbacteria bacterium]
MNTVKPVKNVLIICGRDIDLRQVMEMSADSVVKDRINIHVMNCHRNLWSIMNFVGRNDLSTYSVVIGIATKALPVPTVVDTWVRFYKRNVRVVGVAFGAPDSRDLRIAQIYIKRIPGQSDVLDATGNVYSNSEGLAELLLRISNEDLPQIAPREEKSAKTRCWLG